MVKTGTGKIKTSPGMFPWYAYGNDFGNSEICGVLIKNGKMLTKSVPTAYAEVSASTLKNMNVDTTDALIIQLEGEGLEWGIGELSLLQRAGDIWNGRGDVMRYASRHCLRSILAISGSLTTDSEYGVLVTGGLPAEIYQSSLDPKNDMDLRKEVKRAITGIHTFTLDDGKTWRICHVEYCGTLMEGAGAAASVQKAQKVNPPPIGIIDIGGRTTDLYVAQKGVPIVSFCQGKPLGVVTAENAFRKAFRDRYHFPPTDLEVRQIMFAYANSESLEKKPYPEISNYGSAIPGTELEKMVDTAVQATADAIVSFVASSWNESDSSTAIAARYDPCVCVGGGAWFFFDALRRRIKHLQRHANPVFANAIGYARNSASQLEKRGLVQFQQEVETAKAAASLFIDGTIDEGTIEPVETETEVNQNEQLQTEQTTQREKAKWVETTNGTAI